MTAKLNLASLLVLLTFTFILIFVTNRYILTPEFYAKSDEELDINPLLAQNFYIGVQKWIYLSAVAYLLVKLFVLTCLFRIGFFFAGLKTEFQQVFGVLILAEFTFVIAALTKIVWFHHFYPAGTLTDWYHCYLLSALYIFPGASITWWYPLQTLNLFEVLYWFAIAAGISRTAKLNFDRSLRTVVLTYLPALLIWTAVIVMFSATYH